MKMFRVIATRGAEFYDEDFMAESFAEAEAKMAEMLDEDGYEITAFEIHD